MVETVSFVKKVWALLSRSRFEGASEKRFRAKSQKGGVAGDISINLGFASNLGNQSDTLALFHFLFR
jgi:hypothetical protein